MDQPSIDGINTWYASKAAAECGLKVVVSGVGGDELFQGYESFTTLPRLVRRWNAWARIPGVPALARVAGAVQARRTGNDRWRHAPAWARTIGGAWWLRRSLNAPEALAAIIGDPQAAASLGAFDADRWVGRMCGELAADPRLALGQIESMTYLRNQLLRDSDWASMDHSVELRTPLVDARLLMSLQPVLATFSRYPGKRLLSGVPNDALPREVLERRKTGFGIPVGRWLAADAAGGAAVPDSRAWAQRLVAAFTRAGEADGSPTR
jgi:asparagine synthase (glutamine-hydrolysing)